MAGAHLVVAGNLVLQAQVQVGDGVQQVVAHQLLGTLHAGPPGPEHAGSCPVNAFGNVLREQGQWVHGWVEQSCCAAQEICWQISPCMHGLLWQSNWGWHWCAGF